MKAITIALVVVVMMAVALAFRDSDTISYVRDTEVVEVEVLPEWAKDEQAVKAAQDVIRKKELQAELEKLDSEIKSLQDRRKEIAKELDGY